ncbi:LysR substrate-binding domain-containing protein [Rubrivivax sp. RP6-9]|uniref:LysR substrate-binding domain-containing protein n=1 Tax=Rubrivivax sp. RP6-9 TaxID=3415750 RepID=UPI003CC6B945
MTAAPARQRQMRRLRCHNVIDMKMQSGSMVELHAFLGVCRTGSMRSAAERLCVTQAAVSRAVARLEKHLGYALFERRAQGVLPTARALELRQRIEHSVDAIEQAFAVLRHRSHKAQRFLRLRAVASLGTRWLMPRLGQFQARHPDITIELKQSRREETSWVEDVDVWIEIRRPGRPWPRDISARYLLGREITPVCTQAMAQRLRTPAGVLRESLLHHTNFPGNWALWLDAAGVPSDKVRLGGGFDLASNMIVAASSGMGVAVVQTCLVERELATGELVRPFTLTASTGRGYYVCTRKSVTPDSPAALFRAWIHDIARSDPA